MSTHTNSTNQNVIIFKSIGLVINWRAEAQFHDQLNYNNVADEVIDCLKLGHLGSNERNLVGEVII